MHPKVAPKTGVTGGWGEGAFPDVAGLGEPRLERLLAGIVSVVKRQQWDPKQVEEFESAILHPINSEDSAPAPLGLPLCRRFSFVFFLSDVGRTHGINAGAHRS